jgi:hypothetical protein
VASSLAARAGARRRLAPAAVAALAVLLGLPLLVVMGTLGAIFGLRPLFPGGYRPSELARAEIPSEWSPTLDRAHLPLGPRRAHRPARLRPRRPLRPHPRGVRRAMTSGQSRRGGVRQHATDGACACSVGLHVGSISEGGALSRSVVAGAFRAKRQRHEIVVVLVMPEQRRVQLPHLGGIDRRAGGLARAGAPAEVVPASGRVEGRVGEESPTLDLEQDGRPLYA